jgi:hypothetical protein
MFFAAHRPERAMGSAIDGGRYGGLLNGSGLQSVSK